MKKGKLIATLVLCAALFGACGNQKPEAELHDHDHDHAAHSEHETEPAMEEEAAPENTLVLNEGLRWEANAETTEGVNNMIALMSDFSDSDNLEAYAPLKASLEAESKMIFEKCTMTGEAHNQLHNFLIPIKEALGKFEASDLKQSQENFAALNAHLTEYAKFFEYRER